MKKLFASINIEKGNPEKRRIIRYYKVKEKCFGIEITSEDESEQMIQKIENITKNEEQIDKILKILVEHVEFSFQVKYIVEDLMYENI